MFLRNCWYVAGWSKDYDRSLKAQMLLGENVVLYRLEDGAPAALEDACPHRKLPLSMGQLEGDTVVCGYHGLTFDCAGNVRSCGRAVVRSCGRAVVSCDRSLQFVVDLDGRRRQGRSDRDLRDREFQ